MSTATTCVGRTVAVPTVGVGWNRAANFPVDAGTVMAVVKKGLLIALVVVLVLVGLPIPVGGMGAMTCIDCEQPVTVHKACAAVLFAALVVVVAMAAHSLTRDRRRMLAMLLAGRLERPPQLA
jgi:hypothetical protein